MSYCLLAKELGASRDRVRELLPTRGSHASSVRRESSVGVSIETVSSAEVQQGAHPAAARPIPDTVSADEADDSAEAGTSASHAATGEQCMGVTPDASAAAAPTPSPSPPRRPFQRQTTGNRLSGMLESGDFPDVPETVNEGEMPRRDSLNPSQLVSSGDELVLRI